MAITILLLCIVLSVVSVATASPSRDKLVKTFHNIQKFAIDELARVGPFSPTPDYPYWNFMPQYINSLFTTAKLPVTWESYCFKSNSASITQAGNNITISITSTGSKLDGSCLETYLFSSTALLHLQHVKSLPVAEGITSFTLTLPDDITDAETWDLSKKGIRFFNFAKQGAELLSNVVTTLEMFLPEFEPYVTPGVAAKNVDFLNKYAKFPVTARDTSLNEPPREEDVHSGDFFGLMRMDGLNPMLAWAMGSETGHTTIALRRDGVLSICESTTDSPYWPTNGIQCTPYDTWLKQAKEAGYQVNWAPLGEAASAAFDADKAAAFFDSVKGLDYGFKTLLWGWLDVQTENFPCIPIEAGEGSSNCLQWAALEPVLSFVDRVDNDVGDLIWNDGTPPSTTSLLFAFCLDATSRDPVPPSSYIHRLTASISISCSRRRPEHPPRHQWSAHGRALAGGGPPEADHQLRDHHPGAGLVGLQHDP